MNSEYEQSLISARFVQQGLLPKDRHFKRVFEDHFVFYVPQYIISGDFYWVGQQNDMRYLVVGDCTGHGVSASLLSVLALNLFEYAIMNKGIKRPNKILKEVDKRFIESFKDAGKVSFDNPWIDLAIVCIDDINSKIYFSSANRKLLHVNVNGIATVHKGSRYPIGGWQIEEKRSFESKTISFKKGDVLYLGSDGYQDQIGGKKGKRFSSKRLHSTLEDLHKMPFGFQRERLGVEYLKWKGNEVQLDDICIVGVKL